MEQIEDRMPKISIIVPVYKAEQFLDKCIKSILAQTIKEIELILVDDGSPDKCPQMCDEWANKDKRVRVIHQKNGGVQKAIYEGVKHAKAEYVGFVDSDDWVGETRFEVLINAIIKYDADCVRGGICMIDPNISKRYIKLEETIILDEKEIEEKILTPFWEQDANLYKHWSNGRWDKIYRADILKDIFVGLDLELSMGEDAELNLQYLPRCKRVVSLKDTCDYFNLQVRGSMTHGFSRGILQTNKKYLLTLFSLAEKQNREAKALEYLTDKLYAGVVFQALTSDGGSFKQKLEIIKEAVPLVKKHDIFSSEFNGFNIVVRHCMHMIGNGHITLATFIGHYAIKTVRAFKNI